MIINQRDLLVFGLLAVLIAVGLLGGCAGKMTDVSQEVKEERQKIKKRVGQLAERYKAAREIYVEVRKSIKTKWDIVPEELRGKLKRFDAKAKDFNEQVEKLYDDLEQADKNIEELEKMAKEADKKWTELIETLKNITQIAVEIA